MTTEILVKPKRHGNYKGRSPGSKNRPRPKLDQHLDLASAKLTAFSKSILLQSREKQVKVLRDQAAIVAHAFGKELADVANGSNNNLSPIEQERKAKVFGIAFDKVAADHDQGFRLKLPAKLLNSLLTGLLPACVIENEVAAGSAPSLPQDTPTNSDPVLIENA